MEKFSISSNVQTFAFVNKANGCRGVLSQDELQSAINLWGSLGYCTFLNKADNNLLVIKSSDKDTIGQELTELSIDKFDNLI